MTPNRAKPDYCSALTTALVVVCALGFTGSLDAQAQDSNQDECVAIGNINNAECFSEIEVAASAPEFALDWVPLEDVPEALRDRQCINCEGRYLDPLAEEDTSQEPSDSDIRARADSSELQDNEVILVGRATAIQGYRRMRSDTVTINRNEESAVLSGDVTLREPNVLLQGDRAKIYSQTGEALIYNSQFVLHNEHMRGTADLLERDADGIIHVHNGNITYCAPGENDWAVLSDDMELDLDEGLATAHDATIELEGIPVFYSPWLRFPLDDRRRTGVLWPDFGNDSNGGLDISTPVYLNLAPNYDALYAPRYIEERGLNHELQLRYLNPLVGHWLVGGAYMNSDERYRDQATDDRSTDRWLRIVKQDGLFNSRWRSHIDYGKASDVDYLKDLETSNIDAQRSTSLLQLASMDYLGDNWLMNLRTQQYQSLADDIRKDYELQPQFTNQYRSDGTPFTLQPILVAQYSNFEAEEDVVTGQRVYGEAGASYPMMWRFGELTPTLKYRQVNYALSDATVYTDNSPSTGAPLFNLDGSLIFERQTSFGGNGFLQTLEPRIYYLYSPQEDQQDQPIFDSAELTFNYYQLFRETRFSGHDRLDDANQVSLGVTTRFIEDATGRSRFNASIGQIYYLQDRDVRLVDIQEPRDDATSEIAGELGFNPTANLGLRTSLVWDPNEEDMDSGFVEARYKMDNGSLFNVGYSYRRPVNTVNEFNVLNTQPQTEEASVSTYLPLDNNWSIFGAMNYSIEDNLSVEDMIGVEYDSCCWTVRLVQLRYYNNVNGQIPNFDNPDLERESTVQFQFLLKGMGGFGNRITNIMSDMIRGFEEREY